MAAYCTFRPFFLVWQTIVWLSFRCLYRSAQCWSRRTPGSALASSAARSSASSWVSSRKPAWRSSSWLASQARATASCSLASGSSKVALESPRFT